MKKWKSKIKCYHLGIVKSLKPYIFFNFDFDIGLNNFFILDFMMLGQCIFAFKYFANDKLKDDQPVLSYWQLEILNLIIHNGEKYLKEGEKNAKK